MIKMIFPILILLCVLCLCVGSVSAMSGSGTVSDPYILTTSADLTALSGTGLAGYGVNAYYELGADIDMSSVSDFTSIGTESVIFTGHFDGKNHTISNLKIIGNTNEYYIALFKIVNCGELSNIIFNNVYIKSYAPGCGVLIGRHYATGGDTLIQNIHVNSAYVVSTMSGCSVLVGYFAVSSTNYNTTVSNCSIKNSLISSDSGCGGLISGYCGFATGNVININNCSIDNCYIKCTGAYTGGLFGRVISTLSISNCNVSKSTIIGGTSTGGLYGGMSGSAPTPTVTDCTVSDCSIIGTSNVAGVGN